MNNGGIILCLLNAYLVWFVSFWWSVKFHLGTVEPPLKATSLQRPLCFVPEGKNPYIGSLQRPLYSVPKVTVVEKFNCIKICCFDCIRSHRHCLLQEYSHEYAACKSDIVIVWSSSRVRLAQYICDIIHPTDLMIPNSRILFITGAYLCTQFHSEPVVSRIFNCST